MTSTLELDDWLTTACIDPVIADELPRLIVLPEEPFSPSFHRTWEAAGFDDSRVVGGGLGGWSRASIAADPRLTAVHPKMGAAFVLVSSTPLPGALGLMRQYLYWATWTFEGLRLGGASEPLMAAIDSYRELTARLRRRLASCT